MEHQYLRFYRSRTQARADVEEFQLKLNESTSSGEKEKCYGILAAANIGLDIHDKAIEYANMAQ